MGIPGLSEDGNGDDHHSPGLENIILVVISEGVGSPHPPGELIMLHIYPAALRNFLQMRCLIRPELSFLTLFSFLFPPKNFPCLFLASENVTTSMLLLCYYTGNEMHSWKSLSPTGCMHLNESTQVEIKPKAQSNSLI